LNINGTISGFRFFNGKVILHHRNKKTFSEESRKINEQENYKYTASLYTGELKPPKHREIIDDR
jgi:hypothetical protein